MIFWIIIGLGIVLSILVGIAISQEGFNSAAEGIGAFLFGGFITAATAFGVCAIIASSDKPSPSYYSHPDPPGKILALDDHIEKGTDTNGAFILVAGGYSQHEVTKISYTFYQEAPDGTYFLHTLEPDYDTKIRIKLTGPNIMPTAQRFQPTPHYITQSWIAPMDLTTDGTSTDEKWVLSVPKGTIVNHLKLDAR